MRIDSCSILHDASSVWLLFCLVGVQFSSIFKFGITWKQDTLGALSDFLGEVQYFFGMTAGKSGKNNIKMHSSFNERGGHAVACEQRHSTSFNCSMNWARSCLCNNTILHLSMNLARSCLSRSVHNELGTQLPVHNTILHLY
jgi:hypothetical protein